MAKGKGQSGGRGRAAKKSSAPAQVADAVTVADAAPANARQSVAAAADAAPGGDVAKWAVVGVLVAVAIGLFYYLADSSTLLRVILLLLLLGGAAFVAVRTGPGARAFEFVKDSRVELRKVVWPSRKETMQTTGLILAVVVVVALFIWILDVGLAALVKVLIGSSA